MTIRCLAPQHVLRFFHFWRRFFLFLWNFAYYCVFLLNAPLSDRDEKKKHLCSGLLLPGNLDPSSLSPGGPIVLLVCGFRRRDNLLAWRELFANLCELTSRIWYLREYNHFERFLWYINLIDFRQILPKHPLNDGKRKFVGKFWYLKNLSRGVNATRLAYFYSNFKCRYLDNQSEHRKSLTPFVDWIRLWIRLCSHFARAAASDTR